MLFEHIEIILPLLEVLEKIFMSVSKGESNCGCDVGRISSFEESTVV